MVSGVEKCKITVGLRILNREFDFLYQTPLPLGEGGKSS